MKYQHVFMGQHVNNNALVGELRQAAEDKRLPQLIQDLLNDRKPNARKKWELGSQQDLARIIYKALPYPHAARHADVMIGLCTRTDERNFDDGARDRLAGNIEFIDDAARLAVHRLGIPLTDELYCLCAQVVFMIYSFEFNEESLTAGLMLGSVVQHCLGEHEEVRKFWRKTRRENPYGNEAVRRWLANPREEKEDPTKQEEQSDPRLFENRLRLDSSLEDELRKAMHEFYAWMNWTVRRSRRYSDDSDGRTKGGMYGGGYGDFNDTTRSQKSPHV